MTIKQMTIDEAENEKAEFTENRTIEPLALVRPTGTEAGVKYQFVSDCFLWKNR